MNYWIYSLPFLGAIIGWGINKIAIVSLLRPRRRQQIAEKLGKFAKAEFSSFNLEEKISDPSTLEKAMPLIEGHIDDFLRNKLKEQMPMIGMFIGDKTIETLKTVFMKELQTLFPQVMKQFAANAKAEFDIEKLVMSRINKLSPEKENALKKELRGLEMAGAATGFITGALQVILVQLIQ